MAINEETEQHIRSLMQRIKEDDDEQAFNELVSHPEIDKYTKGACIAYARSSMRRNHSVDFDDYYSHCIYALWRNRNAYDESKINGSVFGIISLTVKGACIGLYRHQKAKRNEFNNGAASLDASLGDDGATLATIIPHTDRHLAAFEQTSEEEIESIARELGAFLSPTEAAVLYLQKQGYSYEQIGEQIGINPKSVDNAVSRIKSKAQDLLRRNGIIGKDEDIIKANAAAVKQAEQRERERIEREREERDIKHAEIIRLYNEGMTPNQIDRQLRITTEERSRRFLLRRGIINNE